MREYFSQALATFQVEGKEVSLWTPAPPWCEEMLIKNRAFLGEKRAHAFVLLAELKKMKGEDDFAAMHVARSMLEPGGLLYVSIPVGKEKTVDDSHRVYGENRMKELFRGWRPVGYFGYSYEDLLKDPLEIHEPVFVLKAR